jgi:hypothetical protein
VLLWELNFTSQKQGENHSSGKTQAWWHDIALIQRRNPNKIVQNAVFLLLELFCSRKVQFSGISACTGGLLIVQYRSLRLYWV